jgi:hypothetical protein
VGNVAGVTRCSTAFSTHQSQSCLLRVTRADFPFRRSTSAMTTVGHKRRTCSALACSPFSNCGHAARGTGAATGRYCCKSLGARWVQLFPGRADALRKSTWGSTQKTARATRDFRSRATMPLNNAFLLQRLSRRFLTPQFFDFCNRIGQERPPALQKKISRPSAQSQTCSLDRDRLVI